MAVTWLDGFDSGDLTKYTVTNVSSASSIGSRAGKQIRLSTSSGSFSFSYSSRYDNYIGARVYAVAGGSQEFMKSTNGDHPYLAFNGTHTGIDCIHKKGASGYTTNAAGSITRNAWYYVELAYSFAGAGTGFVTVKINGVTTYSYTGATWSNTATQTYTSAFTATSNSSSSDYYMDDLYMATAESLGPVTISSLVPTSDVASPWTGSAGGAHYALVDEQPASMTDYVYATAGSALTETYGLTPPGGMGTIPAVQVNAYGLSSDGGAANVTLYADGQASSSLALGASAANVFAVFPTAASSAAWTGTKLGTAAFGIKSS